MWELYLTQTYTSLFAAGCQLISACSLAFHSDESFIHEWRPIARQIETPRRIQLTRNRKEHYLNFLVRNPGCHWDLGGSWTLSTLVVWLSRNCLQFSFCEETLNFCPPKNFTLWEIPTDAYARGPLGGPGNFLPLLPHSTGLRLGGSYLLKDRA